MPAELRQVYLKWMRKSDRKTTPVWKPVIDAAGLEAHLIGIQLIVTSLWSRVSHTACSTPKISIPTSRHFLRLSHWIFPELTKMHDYLIHGVRTCDRKVYGWRPQGNAKTNFYAVALEETQKNHFFTAVALKESSNAKCTAILYMESEHVIEKFTAVALKETQKTFFFTAVALKDTQGHFFKRLSPSRKRKNHFLRLSPSR